MRNYESKYFYAVYDFHNHRCIGVWERAKDVAEFTGLSLSGVYRNIRQTEKGRSFSRSGFEVFRIYKE